jgi:ADP-ribose pyrophosphatase YjhB (NUDIX family)
MPTPEFIVSLRAKVGNDLLLVPTVAVLVSDADGRLLLVQDRENGLWGCPGGIVEPNELPADAAVRETWEESGVLVELTRVAGVFGGNGCSGVYRNGDRVAWVATLFGARAIRGTPSADGAETLDARFFSRDELVTLSLKNSTRQFLERGATTNPGAYFEPSSWQPK